MSKLETAKTSLVRQVAPPTIQRRHHIESQSTIKNDLQQTDKSNRGTFLNIDHTCFRATFQSTRSPEN